MTLPLRDDLSGAELEKAHSEYQDFLGRGFSLYTGKASDLVRQLGLAGVAIIWLFKVTEFKLRSLVRTCELLPFSSWPLSLWTSSNT